MRRFFYTFHFLQKEGRCEFRGCRYALVLDEEVLWLLLEEEEKLLLVRRLLPPLRLTRGRLDGITARDRGGGGAGTREGYEYILMANGRTALRPTELNLD